MKVTVIIPNYNGKHFLQAVLDSMKMQTTKKMEIMVVDNGSEDGSCEYIEEQYPFVHLIRRDKNYGFCNAVNVGIKMASTPFVLLLNNDTQATPDFVEQMVLALKRHPRACSVSSRMLNFNVRTKLDDAGDMYSIIGWQFQRGVGRDRDTYQEESTVFSACAGAAIYRKKVLEKIGYFDEGHFAYLEDMDIGFRAKIYGYENWYCPKAVVYHVGSGTSGSKYNEFKVRLSARNSVYLNYKNMPYGMLILNALPLFLGYLVKWLFFVKKGFGAVYLNGIIEGIQTRHKCKKVPFQFKHLMNYVNIEVELIQNVFLYSKEFLLRRLE